MVGRWVRQSTQRHDRNALSRVVGAGSAALRPVFTGRQVSCRKMFPQEYQRLANVLVSRPASRVRNSDTIYGSWSEKRVRQRLGSLIRQMLALVRSQLVDPNWRSERKPSPWFRLGSNSGVRRRIAAADSALQVRPVRMSGSACPVAARHATPRTAFNSLRMSYGYMEEVCVLFPPCYGRSASSLRIGYGRRQPRLFNCGEQERRSGRLGGPPEQRRLS